MIDSRNWRRSNGPVCFISRRTREAAMWADCRASLCAPAVFEMGPAPLKALFSHWGVTLLCFSAKSMCAASQRPSGEDGADSKRVDYRGHFSGWVHKKKDDVIGRSSANESFCVSVGLKPLLGSQLLCVSQPSARPDIDKGKGRQAPSKPPKYFWKTEIKRI